MKCKWTVVLLAMFLVGQANARDWIVDTAHPAATDDGAAGTREAPLKTIGAAALRVAPGDRVLVQPGIYRETVVLSISGRPEAPIVFEGEVPHAAILSGADPVPAELWTESEPGIWRTDWPDLRRWKLPVHNGEWVYADGVPLLRADTPGELLPGQFWLDTAARAVSIMLGQGRTPADTLLELARRDGLFYSNNWRNSQNLKPDAPWISDIVIRGFTLQHNADWFRGYAAIRISGERWLVENNRIRFGSRMAMQFMGTRDCVARHNTVDWSGVESVGSGPNLNLRFEGNVVRYGNFRRNMPANAGGGSKFNYTLDSVFTGNRFEANYGSGLWFDGFNDANLIQRNRSTDNFGFGGFFSEIGWHDIYTDNVSAYNEIGMLVGESVSTVLRRNIVCGNSRMGIRMRGTYRRKGVSEERAIDRRARMLARMPSLPPERLERWASRLLQYAVLPKYWLLNNCAIYENLVFDNTVNYVEYRVYGDPDCPIAPFVQNFSDRNMFWARDTNQVLFAGPADYVYTNGLAGWQAAANRDLDSVVADPLDPKTDLPEWARGHAFLTEPRRRLNTDLAATGLNIVRSPETALLYARLRRAETLERIALPVTALRACRFTLDDQKWVALWNTEERGYRYITLQCDQPEVVVEDAYGTRRTHALAAGRLDLGMDYRPVFLRGVDGAVAPVSVIQLNVRKFNAVGAAVPVGLELFNAGGEPAALRADLRAGAGFRAEPATWETTLAPGARVTLRAQLVPEGTVPGKLSRVRIDGQFGAMPLCRVSSFAIGEGAGTIPHVAQAIVVDGKTDDWGDLEKRVPLVELADFEQDGFGNARHWSGADDLSAKFYASWTKQGIYWLVLVRDDRPLGCPDGVAAHESDAIEIFLDGRSAEMQWDPKPAEGTVQLGVSPAVERRPSAFYRRPEHLSADTATGILDGGYLIEGFIPFDPISFPAGEWRTGRAVRLALNVLDRDNPKILGTGYSRGLSALGWGTTRVMEKSRDTGKVRPVIRTHMNTTGWRTLTLE